MPNQLAKRRDEIIRDLLYDNWDDTAVSGYDPTLDPDNSLFMPITTNWYRFGNQYPSITLSNFDTTVIGGGDTNWTGMNSGGGLNQERNPVGQLTIRVEDRREGDYNGTDAQDLRKQLEDECDRIIGENGDASFNNEIWWVENSGWTENVETGGEGTVTFTAVSDVGFGWLQTN
jgi:hypothetical protein